MDTAREKIPTPCLWTAEVNYPYPEKFNNYYPFGLTLAGTSYQRLGAQKNKFKYNGKELQDDLGLDWYDYGARMYDGAVGRWWVVDPLAEAYNKLSPYNYVANKPIVSIDPNGMDIKDDVHVDPETGEIDVVDTPWPDRLFIGGKLVAQYSYDGELSNQVKADNYYSSYSHYFSAKLGNRLLNDNFFQKQLNALPDNYLKSELLKARVSQSINTYGTEIVLYILEVYGTLLTVGELTTLIQGLSPVAKTFIKNYVKKRANAKVLKNAGKHPDDIKKMFRILEDIRYQEGAIKYLDDLGMDNIDEIIKKLEKEIELEKIVKEYYKN